MAVVAQEELDYLNTLPCIRCMVPYGGTTFEVKLPFSGIDLVESADDIGKMIADAIRGFVKDNPDPPEPPDWKDWEVVTPDMLRGIAARIDEAFRTEAIASSSGADHA